MAERILNLGGKRGALASEHWRRQLVGWSQNPPPKNFEILKLGNATFIIYLFYFLFEIEGGGAQVPLALSPAPPSLRDQLVVEIESTVAKFSIYT